MSLTTIATNHQVQVYGGTLTPVGHAGGALEIGADPVIVGRDPNCWLVLNDRKVSTLHVELTATPRGVRLRDLGSKNGTYVDKHQITDGYLRAPCRLQWGDTVFQFVPGAPFLVETGTAESFGPLVGQTEVMRTMFLRLRKLAATDVPVLIIGETGTGKELVAQALHSQGARASQPFVVIDCAAISATLVESTLFGHERGAFTGAVEKRVSPFLRAAGGTVFLDEIGELPLELQPRLLRVIETRTVQPVGADRYFPVNVRIIAATRRDLRREANTNAFRSDLFFRLAQAIVEVPALRQRAEDIPHLIEYFARDIGAAGLLQRVSQTSLLRLLKHDWPGNVRELRNAVTTCLKMADPYGPIELDSEMSGSRVVGAAEPAASLDEVMAQCELKYWRELFERCGGNNSQMSRISGRARSNVRANLIRLGIRSTEHSDSEG